MATIGRLATIAFLGLPLLSATPAVACIPAEHYTTQNSIDIAEGFVIAKYGRIDGVPVPLAAAKIATLFGAGDGVAVVFVDRVVKGTSPRIIFVSQGWVGLVLIVEEKCRDTAESPS